MCGLVGFIAKWSSGCVLPDLEVFKQLLYVDTLRGEDATGICLINKYQGASIYKEASEAHNFLWNTDLFDSLKKSGEWRALLGHNRKATVGKKVDNNAHPFIYEDRYAFFHNGTIHNPKDFGNEEVDSEAFGKHIVACNGDLEKLSSVFEKAFGAWACVWYDSVLNTIYLSRNSQRPLSIIYLKSGDIIYSSESWMGAGIATRNNKLIEKIETVKENNLISIKLSETGFEISEQELPKKQYVPQAIHGHVFGGTNIKQKKPEKNIQLSKKAAAHFTSKLKSTVYVTFTIDDVQSNSVEAPAANHCYDWLVSGYNEQYPGVLFKGVIKDKFPYEIKDLETNTCWGTTSIFSYEKGILEAWLDEVYLHDYVH